MLSESNKKLAKQALQQLKGDDLYRATQAFQGFNAEQMKEQYGQSGQTRQEILDSYRQWAKKIDAAIAEIDAN